MPFQFFGDQLDEIMEIMDEIMEIMDEIMEI